MKLVPWLAALGVVASACAKPAGERAPSVPAPSGAATETVPTGAPPPAVPQTAASDTAAPPSAAAPPFDGGTPPRGPVAPERHGPSIPELTIKSFGLHIGGGAADAAARGDFLRALEGSTSSYLDCYRTIDEPGRTGTFGVDLTIGGGGGKARVGKPRTKLPGQAFQTCMLRALENVSFPRTPSGRAVVVSYSVKFSFADAR